MRRNSRICEGHPRLTAPIAQNYAIAPITQDEAADLMGVSRRSVPEAKAIREKDPELAEKVERKEVKFQDAIRDTKRAEIVEKLEETAARATQDCSGVFDVIVIDPPWPMSKIERDERPNQSEFEYPTMSEESILGWGMPQSKAADNCHVFRGLPRNFCLWHSGA